MIGYSANADGTLHDLLLATVRADGSLHTCGRVGSGFDARQRVQLPAQLAALHAEGNYVPIYEQRAYQLVRPSTVVEVQILDLLTHKSNGENIDYTVINWDPISGEYSSITRLPLASLIAPQFVRIREDKSCHPHDAGIYQFTNLVEIQHSAEDVFSFVLPGSTILQREVYSKTVKTTGATSVRKFILYKTNKEQLNPDFPAYVAYYLDFSPSRAKALDRTVMVSSSLDQISALFEQLKANNVKGGWNLSEVKKRAPGGGRKPKPSDEKLVSLHLYVRPEVAERIDSKSMRRWIASQIGQLVEAYNPNPHGQSPKEI